MVNIKVAGAGAGKTTSMSNSIIESYNNSLPHRNIYCIAFTNNASDNIKEKIKSKFGCIPNRIKISTIHSFLYQEIIKPYYFLLFNKDYKKISSIELPSDHKLSNYKINELDKNDTLHVKAIPQRAKWVFVKKYNDTSAIKKARKIIQGAFFQYCEKIFIDEAQDIDNDVFEILNEFIKLGIDINIVGDPKQDLKGFGKLDELILKYEENIEYINICHRCPNNHISLSNSIVDDLQKQNSEKSNGKIGVVFESDINLSSFIDSSNFDLKYISQKNSIFNTQKSSTSFENETLFYELEIVLKEKFPDKDENALSNAAYFYANKLLFVNEKNLDENKTLREVFPSVRFSSAQYARICNAMKLSACVDSSGIYVPSIESIKGQEGYNCLFVLTNDLASYLFQEKKEKNKTKNKLYVALTRSLKDITLLIAKEVENKYGKEYILKYLNKFS
jgi:hypothetical protein